MSSALDNVNYLVDICKSVVNPIGYTCEYTSESGCDCHVEGEDCHCHDELNEEECTCESHNNCTYVMNSYEAWIVLCMMWSGVSIPSDNKERCKYGISQVLGEVEPSNGYGIISKATLFDGTPNERYCYKTWYEGSISNFRKNYNLYFKD
jgi:hypothetical protein